MAVSADIKFTQGPNTDLAGRAVKGTVAAGPVTITNGVNTDVASWSIEMLYAPPGSSYTPIPGVPTVLASAVNNTPTATFTPDVPGPYRIRETVHSSGGATNVDIRNFIVPFGRRGLIVPPYQKRPDPLPLPGSGQPNEKADEMNLGGQPFGWTGDGDSARKLLFTALEELDDTVGLPDFSTKNQDDTVQLSISNLDISYEVLLALDGSLWVTSVGGLYRVNPTTLDFENVAVGINTYGLRTDGTYVYARGYGGSPNTHIFIFNLTGALVGKINIGFISFPSAFALDGTGGIWVGDTATGFVSGYTVTSALSAFPYVYTTPDRGTLGFGLIPLSLEFGDGFLWMTNYNGSTVDLIKIDTTIPAQVGAPFSQPPASSVWGGLFYEFGSLWMDFVDSVQRFDTTTFPAPSSKIADVPVPPTTAAYERHLASDGTTIWVTGAFGVNTVRVSTGLGTEAVVSTIVPDPGDALAGAVFDGTDMWFTSALGSPSGALIRYSAGLGTEAELARLVYERVPTFRAPKQDSNTIELAAMVAAGGLRSVASVLTTYNPNSLEAVDVSSFTNGAVIYVDSVRSYYKFDTSVSFVSDGLDTVAASGYGSWRRLPLPAPQWLLRSDWFVDPSIGNDENDGTIGSPLASVYEAQIRVLGTGARLRQTTTLHIVSDLLASDRIRIDVDLKPGDYFIIDGVVTLLTSGTIDSVVNYDGVNQALEITETGHGSWAAQEFKRIRLDSGPDIGKIGWILKDLGADTARCSFFAGSTFDTVAEPTGGTDYVLEAPPVVTASTIRVLGGVLVIQNLHFEQADNIKIEVDATPIVFACAFVSTNIIGTLLKISDFTTCLSGCYFHKIIITGSPGCILIGCAGSGNDLIGSIIPGDSTLLIRSTVIQGAPFALAPSTLFPFGFLEAFIQIDEDVVGGGLGIFDSGVEGMIAPLGTHIRCLGNGRIWGSGNVSYGIRMNGKLTYEPSAKPTIIGGGAADTRIGGVDKNYGALPYFNPNNGAMIVEEPT